MQATIAGRDQELLRSEMIDDEDRAAVESAFLAVNAGVRPASGGTLRDADTDAQRALGDLRQKARLLLRRSTGGNGQRRQYGGAEEWRGDDVLAEFLRDQCGIERAEPETSE